MSSPKSDGRLAFPQLQELRQGAYYGEPKVARDLILEAARVRSNSVGVMPMKRLFIGTDIVSESRSEEFFGKLREYVPFVDWWKA